MRFNDIQVEEEYRGITNLIITNQRYIPDKNYRYDHHYLNDSYDHTSSIKTNFDKINTNNNQIISKFNSYEKISKEKEIIKYPNFNCLYYSVLPGNASYLIEKCMKHRINWIKPFSVVSTLFNFKWQELSYGIDYSSLGCFPNIKQLVNHFENHFTISNKAKMFTNLLYYCEKRNISAFKYVPFTIIFNLKDDIKNDKDNKKNSNDKINKYDKLKEILNSIENFLMNYEDIGTYYQNGKFIKYMNYIKSKERRGDYKNLNYSDFKKLSKRASKLLRKNKKRNTASYSNKKKDTETDKENNINSGFTLYSDYFNNLIEENSVPIYDKNKEQKIEEENSKMGNKLINNEEKNNIGINTCIEIPKTHYTGKNIWIVKAINLNRGMCIKIVNSYEQMVKVINKFKEGVDYNFTKERIEENNEINTENNKEIPDLNKSASKIAKNFNNRNNRKKLNSADKTKTILINKEIIKSKNESKLTGKNDIISVEKNVKSKTSIEPKDVNKNKIEEQKKIKEMKEKEKLYNCNRIIIQKYIENPLLYKGRKFDMRIWVLLTHTMKVYVFKEGHLKTCSIEYNLNTKDVFAHITNYSFQKYNTNFQKYEKGNEVPFFEFQNFLKENYPDKKYSIKENLIKQIKEIIKVTMRSVKYKINKNRRNYQFEIFGYDFMMDNDFNLFLIEINTNPGLEESSPWIKIIVPRMLDDALRLTIDQLFETKYDFDSINKNKTKAEINNYKNLLNSYNKIINNNKDENHKKESSTEYINKKDINISFNKKKNLEIEDKSNNIKYQDIDKDKKKYISPFPVPGYSLDENIWDFVCDLDDIDPLDESPNLSENINKEKENEKIYIGYRSYRKSKKRKIKNMKNKNKKHDESEEDEESKNSSS